MILFRFFVQIWYRVSPWLLALFLVNGVVKPHVPAWMLPLRGVTAIGAVFAFSAGGLPGAGRPLRPHGGGGAEASGAGVSLPVSPGAGACRGPVPFFRS